MIIEKETSWRERIGEKVDEKDRGWGRFNGSAALCRPANQYIEFDGGFSSNNSVMFSSTYCLRRKQKKLHSKISLKLDDLHFKSLSMT